MIRIVYKTSGASAEVPMGDGDGDMCHPVSQSSQDTRKTEANNTTSWFRPLALTKQQLLINLFAQINDN